MSESCQLVAVGRSRPKRRQITDVLTLALVGFLGGLITGISPCILPVLPVIFFSGAQSVDAAQVAKPEGAVAVRRKRALSATLRPYRAIVVLSFGMVTSARLGIAVSAASTAGRHPLGRTGRLVAIGAGRLRGLNNFWKNCSPVALQKQNRHCSNGFSGWAQPWAAVSCVAVHEKRPFSPIDETSR